MRHEHEDMKGLKKKLHLDFLMMSTYLIKRVFLSA